MGCDTTSTSGEEGYVSGITSKLSAAFGALVVVACASPLTAQTWHQRGRLLRYEAVWVERSQAALRGPGRWFGVARRGPVVVVAGAPWVRPRVWWLRRPAPWPLVFARPLPPRWIRRPAYARPWGRRAWIGRRYRAL